MDAADSKEEEAKKLPLEHQVAHEEWKQQAMPARMDLIPTGMESSLYQNWWCMRDTKPKNIEKASPYKMPKEEAEEKLSLEDELDADSVFDPPVIQFSIEQGVELTTYCGTKPATP